jgi:hypothetical protein
MIEQTLNARATGAPVSDELARLTFYMKDAGGADAEIAKFLEAISSGAPVPPIPRWLHAEQKSFLRRIGGAANARGVEFIDLGELFIAVAETLVHGQLLLDGHHRTLNELRCSGREGARVAAVVDQLLAREHPKVRPSIPLDARHRLLSLRMLGRKKPPPDLLNTITEAVVRVKCLGIQLSRHEERLLSLLAGCAPPWPTVASFLRAFSRAAESPEIPDSLPPRVHQSMVRLVHCTHEIYVPTLWFGELICLHSEIGSTGLSLWRLVHQVGEARARRDTDPELEGAILEQLRQIRSQGDPHILAGEYLMSLLRAYTPPDVPENVPVPIRLFLRQASAVVNDETTPLDASIIAQAAVRTRFTGSALGDYLRFSLEAMSATGGEMRRFAQYMARIAARREPWPLPEFETPQLAQAAGHVRALCDPGVGEPRLLQNEGTGHGSAPAVSGEP